MALLFGISIVFMAVAFLVGRPWTIALPFVVWLGIWLLGAMGLITGGGPIEAALVAGVMGALFAIAGLVLRKGQANRRPRA